MRWPWRRRAQARVVFIGGVPDFTPPPAPATPRVQLGFADGSTMSLSDDDPRAIALREAASRLTGTQEVT